MFAQVSFFLRIHFDKHPACHIVSNFCLEIRVIQARLFSKDSSGRANRGNEHHSGENVRRLKCSDMDFLDFNSAFFKEGKSQCLSLKWEI